MSSALAQNQALQVSQQAGNVHMHIRACCRVSTLSTHRTADLAGILVRGGQLSGHIRVPQPCHHLQYCKIFMDGLR